MKPRTDRVRVPTLLLYRYTFVDGPLDGQVENIVAAGLETHVDRPHPTKGGVRLHYRLAEALPADPKSPISVRYLFVTEFLEGSDSGP